jgi:hypothetical protein
MASRFTRYQYKNTTRVDQIVQCDRNGSVKVAPGQTVTLYREADADAGEITLQDDDGDKINITQGGQMPVRVIGRVTTFPDEGGTWAVSVVNTPSMEPAEDAEFTVVQKVGEKFTVIQTEEVTVKPMAGQTFPVSVASAVTVQPVPTGFDVTTRGTRVAVGTMWSDAGAAKTLTAAYVADSGIDMSTDAYAVLTLLLQYTPGAAETSNSVQVKIEFSDDGTNWYQQSNNDASVALMEYTFTMVGGAGVTDMLALAIPMGPVLYVRVSAKESGVAANFGTLLIRGVLGW